MLTFKIWRTFYEWSCVRLFLLVKYIEIDVSAKYVENIFVKVFESFHVHITGVKNILRKGSMGTVFWLYTLTIPEIFRYFFSVFIFYKMNSNKCLAIILFPFLSFKNEDIKRLLVLRILNYTRKSLKNEILYFMCNYYYI